MAVIIEMPKLSDTMTAGTLIAWLKKEGDPVSSGDMIAEVETDKATMELEAFDDGILLRQLVAEGDQVDVGTPIAAIGEKGEKVDLPSAAGKKAKQPMKAAPEKAPAEETETPAQQPTTEPAKTETVANDKDSSTSEATTAKEKQDPAPQDEPSKQEEAPEGRVKISPLARKLAAEKGIDYTVVKGTGPGGRIVRADILNAPAATKSSATKAASAGAAALPAASGSMEVAPEEDIPLTNMRATIARRLLESKTSIPHFYVEMEVDAAPLTALRESLNKHLQELPPEKGGIKLTVNDFILKASAEAIRRVPAINRSWKEKSIQQHASVHLAFGVAIDESLLTPVIRDAHAKTLRQIATEARHLIAKARSKKLKPDEMTGSTFTVTNLGMFGVSSFYGIINPPNAAILSVGASLRQPVINSAGEIVPGERMKIGLSGDHRVVDGAAAAQYLQALRLILETPALMLV